MRKSAAFRLETPNSIAVCAGCGGGCQHGCSAGKGQGRANATPALTSPWFAVQVSGPEVTPKVNDQFHRVVADSPEHLPGPRWRQCRALVAPSSLMLWAPASWCILLTWCCRVGKISTLGGDVGPQRNPMQVPSPSVGFYRLPCCLLTPQCHCTHGEEDTCLQGSHCCHWVAGYCLVPSQFSQFNNPISLWKPHDTSRPWLCFLWERWPTRITSAENKA